MPPFAAQIFTPGHAEMHADMQMIFIVLVVQGN